MKKFDWSSLMRYTAKDKRRRTERSRGPVMEPEVQYGGQTLEAGGGGNEMPINLHIVDQHCGGNLEVCSYVEDIHG